MMKKITIFGLTLILFLGSCRVGPRYNSPASVAPENWKNSHDKEETAPSSDCWWEVFEDPILNGLEEQAVENNPNLYTAFERIFEARAIACINKADLYPQLSLNPAGSYSNMNVKFHGLPVAALPGLNLRRFVRIHDLEYTVPVNMSYEVDLWGKIQSQYESAFLNAEAQEEAFLATLLTLTADVASNYFNLKTLDAQIDLYEKTLEIRRQTLALTQSRFSAGLVPYTDVTNSMQLVANTESDYHDIVRQRNLIENALAVLLGMPAPELSLEHNPLSGNPPVIPAGIPSDVLLRRPDIAEAERTMASDHALIGAAYADYFPSLNITGALSNSWYEIVLVNSKRVITWQNRLWSLGANVAQFLFDAGKRCCNVEAKWARYREDLGNYEQTVMTAFREVEDALNNIEQEAKQSASLANAVEAATQTEQLSLRRYTNGLSNFLDLLDSQRNELDAKRNYLNVQGARFQSTISLIKALGGGWSSPNEAVDVPDECL